MSCVDFLHSSYTSDQWSSCLFFQILSECSYLSRSHVGEACVHLCQCRVLNILLFLRLSDQSCDLIFFKNLTECSYLTQCHDDACPFTTTLAIHVIDFLQLSHARLPCFLSLFFQNDCSTCESKKKSVYPCCLTQLKPSQIGLVL